MTLILAGVPVAVVFAAAAVLAAGAAALIWRDGALLTALSAWAKARVTGMLKRRVKTGRTVERA